MKLGVRQTLASAAVFAVVMLGIVSVDDRVRDHFTGLATEGGVSSLGSRATGLVDTLAAAARHQSIENAPLVIFAAVGAVLVVFMLKA